MRRILLLAMGLGLTMFGPIAAFRAPEWLGGQTASVPSSQPPAVQAAADADKKPGAEATKTPTVSPPVPLEPALEGLPIYDFADIFRFDISPGWIMSRWSRVSAGLGTLQLHGYRVPLVTGTAEDDLAGSLTYYFNATQQVQRITFSGTTGDARRLVHFITRRYGFARRVANDPSLFIYEIPEPRGPARNTLQIKPARVLSADRPYQRFDVELALERPAEKKRL
jgi:hypothetical protein